MLGEIIDTSWNHKVNPENTPWVPGYRFYVRQPSQKVSRALTKMRPRVYRVEFEIDRDGLLKHTFGVKPTPETLAAVERLYAEGRPGSNGAPAMDDAL